MKIPYFCCIGAELKRYAKDFDFMNQVYLYKVPTDDSIDEVLAEDYFKAISDSVLQDDIVYIYEASSETLHSCRFDKQNGHITAVPLASDETLTGAVTTIIHDNLTKNRAVISNGDGKVAVSNVTSTELGYLSGATSNIQTQLNNKANAYEYASNCITEIPQDIKLELGTGDNAGKMILKAGSKAYIPNGSGVFDTVVIPNDIIITASSSYTRALFLTASGGRDYITIDRLYSGATAPTGFTGTAYWYDTANNVFKSSTDSGSTWSIPSDKKSLPLALFTTTSGAITSIDQVFNGFGFIGSTVFALPGVKYLCPDGRNTDGTLKNTSATVQNVIAKTVPTNLGWHYMTLNSAGTNGDLATNFYEGTEKPSNPTTYSRYYNSVENKIYNIVSGVYGSAVQAIVPFRIEHGSSSPYSITSWNSPTVFHAVDYNDTEFIAHQAMPSDRYVTLTLGSSGTNYTMPADGYLCFSKNAGAADEYVTLRNETAHSMSVTSSVSNTGLPPCRVFLPVSKGDSVKVTYTLTGATDYFQFIYANGAK